MTRAFYWATLFALVMTGARSTAAQRDGRFVEAGAQLTRINEEGVPAMGLRFGYAPPSGFGIEAGVEYVRNRSVFDADEVLGHARALLAVRYGFPLSKRLGLDLGLGIRRGLQTERTLCGYERPYRGSVCGTVAGYTAGGPEGGVTVALSSRTSIRAGGGLLSSGSIRTVGGPWGELGVRVWL